MIGSFLVLLPFGLACVLLDREFQARRAKKRLTLFDALTELQAGKERAR